MYKQIIIGRLEEVHLRRRAAIVSRREQFAISLHAHTKATHWTKQQRVQQQARDEECRHRAEAAVVLQSFMRRRLSRRGEQEAERTRAALVLQAAVRGSMVRRAADSSTQGCTVRQQRAVRRLQRMARSALAATGFYYIRNGKRLIEYNLAPLLRVNAELRVKSACQLQAHARGYLARAQVHRQHMDKLFADVRVLQLVLKLQAIVRGKKARGRAKHKRASRTTRHHSSVHGTVHRKARESNDCPRAARP